MQCAMQGNKPMVEKIIVRALKSLSDNQVVINRDVWLKVGVPALFMPAMPLLHHWQILLGPWLLRYESEGSYIIS